MALIYLFIKRHGIYWNNVYLFQMAYQKLKMLLP